MDPYLEDPPIWAGVHQALISSIRALLNARLPPAFVADAGERLYLIERDRNIYPDVLLLQRPHAVRRGGAVATMTPTIDNPWTISTLIDEMRQPYIQIVTARHPARVVTIIEILSPGNKASGSQLRKLYLEKQEQLLVSGTHFIEIDLLRAGTHTVRAPFESLRRKGTWDYLCCLHRAGLGSDFEVWPARVRDRLPRVAVPLDEEWPDVPLDLQEAVDRAYDEGGYSRWIDYADEPADPLSAEDADWADSLLRAAGKR
jgi:hypothetical protein